MNHQSGDRIHVLHVDTDQECADLTATVLEDRNRSFTVETATDSQEGLRKLTPDVDCIVSGYELPGRSGVEFLETVRETYPELPFILFTGEGNEEVASDAIAAGVTGYIRKQAGDDQHAVLADGIETSVRQQRSRVALESMRVRMDLALDSTDSIIFEVDFETRAEMRYGPFERLFGIASDRVDTFDAFCTHCVHPADAGRIRALQQPANLSDRTDTLAYEFRTHPDHGEVRWIWAEAHVETSPGGEPQRLIGLNTDITDRKQREQELKRQNERLEEFASVVSHDLRNPLNVANLRLELAMRESDNEHLGIAMQSLERMETLIDDLLTLTQTGQRVTEMEPIDLGVLAETCWHTVETAEATVVIDTDRTIRADRSRLRQLVENLLSNAIEHGGPDVTVTVGDCGGPGFYIADDGPGIPEADRERVFDSAHSTKETGGGLGLSIVEAVVDAHGWEISVTDSETGGTRFEVGGVDTVA